MPALPPLAVEPWAGYLTSLYFISSCLKSDAPTARVSRGLQELRKRKTPGPGESPDGDVGSSHCCCSQ